MCAVVMKNAECNRQFSSGQISRVFVRSYKCLKYNSRFCCHDNCNGREGKKNIQWSVLTETRGLNRKKILH